MRPEERSVQSEVERDQQFRKNVGKGVGTAVGAATALAAGAATARIIPFLNKMIPADLALKGLAKVSPKVADFLKRGQSMGLNIEEGLQYLRDGISSKEEQQQAQKPKDNRSIIEQYSPELHQFMSQAVSAGRTPIEAGAIAQHDKRFTSIINKLSKDHKTPWSQIIDSVYGSGQYGGAINPTQQGQQQQMQQPQQQAQAQQGAPQPGQPGPGQQALMAILQKINQKLGQ